MRQLRARQAAHAALAEIFGREQLRVVGAVDERVGVGAPLLGLGQRGPVDQRTQHATRPVRRLPAAAHHRFGLYGRGRACVGCDKHTAARPRLQKALIDQLQIGRSDRVAAQAQQQGELARGRQWRTNGEAPVQNGLYDRLAQAALKGQGARFGQRKQLRPLGSAGRGHGSQSNPAAS